MTERAIIIRNVPEDLRRDLKIAAIQEGETMQGLIVRVLREWRDKRKEGGDNDYRHHDRAASLGIYEGQVDR